MTRQLAHLGVAQSHRVRPRDVEPVRVVSRRVAVAQVVRLVSFRVVEGETGHGETRRARDVEAVRRPVLDVQVLDQAVRDLLDHEEVVGLVTASVGAFTIPVGRAVAVDHVAFSPSDGWSGVLVSHVLYPIIRGVYIRNR